MESVCPLDADSFCCLLAVLWVIFVNDVWHYKCGFCEKTKPTGEKDSLNWIRCRLKEEIGWILPNEAMRDPTREPNMNRFNQALCHITKHRCSNV